MNFEWARGVAGTPTSYSRSRRCADGPEMHLRCRLCMFISDLSMLLPWRLRPEGVDAFTYQTSVAARGQVGETVVSSGKEVARFGIATQRQPRPELRRGGARGAGHDVIACMAGLSLSSNVAP